MHNSETNENFQIGELRFDDSSDDKSDYYLEFGLIEVY